MTAIKSGEADRYAANPPKKLVAALIFGPDTGLVRERAEAMLKSVVEDLNDPFRVADLDNSILTQDGARLADEAAALSMLGGRRVVRVRDAGNGLARLFDGFLDADAEGALVVVEAGDLPKSSALRKVFEEADNAAAIPCYPDTARDLSDVVRDAMKKAGIAITPDALEEAVSRLGSDRGVTRREIEKLALYAHDKKKIDAEDVIAILGDEADTRTEEAAFAAGSGDIARLDLALERLTAAETQVSTILRGAMGHFQRVLTTKLSVDRGETVDGAMRKFFPPIHFSRVASFKAQVQRWTEPRLLDALDMLFEAEALSRTTAVPAEAVMGRALFNVAALAKAAR